MPRPRYTVALPKAKLTTLFTCPRFSVVEFPWHQQAHYRIVSPRDGILAITVRQDGRFVFVRQTRPGYAQPVLEPIAGGMEPHERPATTARREVLEEAGYSALRVRTLASFAPDISRIFGNAHLCEVMVGNCPDGAPTEKDLPDAKVVTLTVRQVWGKLRSGGFHPKIAGLLLYYLSLTNRLSLR